MDELQARLAAALQIAKEAGDILVSYVDDQEMDVRAKGARDVVTAADIASEKFIAGRLAELFPGDAIEAEEGGAIRGGHRWRWYVDPLDGTLNYSRGIPVWCVSVAAFLDGEPMIGAIHDPLRSETFGGTARGAVQLNTASISSDRTRGLPEAVVHVTTDFEQENMHEGLQDLIMLQSQVLRTRNLGSAALGLAYLATGRLDGMIHRHAHTWDYGAGAALVRGTGGVVTAADGSPFTEQSDSVLAAATPELHGALLDVLRAERPASLE